jgi:hypothetical protein
MKKYLPAAIVLGVTIGIGLVLFWWRAPFRFRAEEIAPPDAIIFAQFPDIPRTGRRWPETGLSQLWHEPEMQAFLVEPLARWPVAIRSRELARRFLRTAPREAFVAVVSIDGPEPQFVAGLHFASSRNAVSALMAEPWAAWRTAHPAGRAEVLRRPRWEIETHASEEKVLAGCFHAGWYFLANDLAALEATLERCHGDRNTGIGSTVAFRRASAPLPEGFDALVFAQPGGLLDRFGALLEGAYAAAKSAADVAPVAWSVKLEGERIRDTIFIPGFRSPEVPLRRNTQALTAPESLLYGAFLLPARMELPPATAPLLSLLTTQPWIGQTSWPEFHAAFGPEGGCILDWPPSADAPSLSFVFQVRDTARATQFVESLTGPSARGARWQRRPGAGITFFQAPEDRVGGTAPAVASMPEFVVLGAQSHAVRTVAERLRPGGADITHSAPFHEIMDRVKTPSTAFAYLDLRALFERSYGTLRPFLGMSLALSPETAPYFDAAKLPSSDAFARHLGPSVYSQTSRHDGIFIESVGTLSLSQTLASLVGATWSSIGPTVGRLGENRTGAPAPARSKAAENSRKSENADETSQIQPFQR